LITQVGRLCLTPITFHRTISLARPFIFHLSGHFMSANTTDLEKRLWNAANDPRAIPKQNRSIFDAS
jgi:hypothetical protein